MHLVKRVFRSWQAPAVDLRPSDFDENIVKSALDHEMDVKRLFVLLNLHVMMREVSGGSTWSPHSSDVLPPETVGAFEMNKYMPDGRSFNICCIAWADL